MKRFVRLFDELSQTTRTGEKVSAVVRYLDSVKHDAPEDAAWAVYLLSGKRLKRAVNWRVTYEAALEATGVPAWLLDECREVVGDSSETVALLMPETGRSWEGTLSEVIDAHLMPIAAASEHRKRALLLGAWRELSPEQVLVFQKLISGTFRFGVQKLLLVRAMAEVSGTDTAEMSRRLAGVIEPTPECFHALLTGEGLGEQTRPYPFCLAHQLAGEPEQLGEIGEYLIEYKWDGIRAQLIRRRDGEGRTHTLLWSRGEEVVTQQFPEIVDAAAAIAAGTVLDGEILMWSGEEGALPFSELQRRLGRKDAQPGLFDAGGVAMLCFDLLEEGGEDLRQLALDERRERLVRVLTDAKLAGRDEPIRLVPTMSPRTWEEAAALRMNARTGVGAEGLMIKRRSSAYHAGRVHGDGGWYKWKLDPYTVDAVLMYAQPGSGKRSGLFTDYTFGVWDDAGDGDARKLVPFAKAYSGLSNDEIAVLDSWIRRHATDRMGPVRGVKPEKVFEIGFEGIRVSDRHSAGVAVRFPRILRERVDKAAHDADTLETVRELLPTHERALLKRTRKPRVKSDRGNG